MVEREKPPSQNSWKGIKEGKKTLLWQQLSGFFSKEIEMVPHGKYKAYPAKECQKG